MHRIATLRRGDVDAAAEHRNPERVALGEPDRPPQDARVAEDHVDPDRCRTERIRPTRTTGLAQMMDRDVTWGTVSATQVRGRFAAG